MILFKVNFVRRRQLALKIMSCHDGAGLIATPGNQNLIKTMVHALTSDLPPYTHLLLRRKLQNDEIK